MGNAQFQRIAEKYIDTVYRVALSFCNSKSDAEDAVQNAFYKLMQTDLEFADDEHIRRWLIKVAINECKMMLRSYWNKNVISYEETTLQPTYIENEKKELFDAVMKLPAKYRVVVHLYYYEGYSCAEIAKLLSISSSSVQTRLQRARNKLKEQLKEA